MTPVPPDFLSALVSIILIDLVLAGDNAIIIGIAARNVPKDKQRAVILWGTAGAIGVRVLLTGAVVWLLKIPGFLLVGGVALVWIGWKLTAPQDSSPEKIAAAASFGAAVRTIVIADAVMGIDNVLAVGGAAQGSFLLVMIGLIDQHPDRGLGQRAGPEARRSLPGHPVARRGGDRLDRRQDDRRRAAAGVDFRAHAVAEDRALRCDHRRPGLCSAMALARPTLACTSVRACWSWLRGSARSAGSKTAWTCASSYSRARTGATTGSTCYAGLAGLLPVIGLDAGVSREGHGRPVASA